MDEPRDPYDQISRALLKFRPKIILPWLMSRFMRITGQKYSSWEDTRRLAKVRVSRTDDLVAILSGVLNESLLSYLIIEVVTEPAWDTVFKVGVYELFLGQEIAGEFPDRMNLPIHSLVLGLTGQTTKRELNLGFTQGDKGSRIAPFRADLSTYKLERLFEDVSANPNNNILLAFAPLCRISGESKTAITRWRTLANAEPDPEVRALIREAILVYAELSKQLVVWQQGIEGYAVRESQIVNAWKKEGRDAGELKKAREDVLLVGQARMQGEAAPERIRNAIDGTNDLEILTRWLVNAVQATSWDDVERAIRSTHAGS